MADELALTVKEAARRLGMEPSVIRAELNSEPQRLRGFKRRGSSLWVIPTSALQDYLDLIEAEYDGAFRERDWPSPPPMGMERRARVAAGATPHGRRR